MKESLNSTPEAILSDADGTLIDTLYLIRRGQYETSKKYLTEHGISEEYIPDYETYKLLVDQTVGTSARDTLEKTVRLLYQNQPHHLETINFDHLYDGLNTVQDQIAPEYVKAYEGLSEFLSTLGRTGIKLAIFTSGTPHYIVRNFGVALPDLELKDLYKDRTKSDQQKLNIFAAALKKHYELPSFAVVTCEDTATHKPSPESLNIAIERLGVTPDKSIVLGDHKVDMQAGVNAGIPQRIGITHGFGSREELVAEGATNTIDSLPELTTQLRKQSN